MIKKNTNKNIETFEELANLSDYSFINKLNSDPDAKYNADNKSPREVFSGHYVPVSPTPIKDPIYISHSNNFFEELGFSESLIKSNDLLIKKDLRININSEEKTILSEFYIIDIQKLVQLDDETVASWARKGWMGILDAHLKSIPNFEKILRLNFK